MGEIAWFYRLNPEAWADDENRAGESNGVRYSVQELVRVLGAHLPERELELARVRLRATRRLVQRRIDGANPPQGSRAAYRWARKAAAL